MSFSFLLSDVILTIFKADNNSEVFYIINGRVGNDNALITRRNNVYPCFYLKSDVIHVSGSGTQTAPLRIA